MQKSPISSLFYLVLFLSPLVTFSQPSIGDEGFTAIKEAYSYDETLALNPAAKELKKFPSHTRTEFYFTGVRERVGAYIAIPTRGQGPFPVIILIDGMGGSKESWWGKDNWSNGLETTEALIAKGFAVFTIDAAMHGERFDIEGVFPKPSSLRKAGLIYTVGDMIKQTAQDYMRGLDYLESRNDINIDKVGVYGLSMGGAVSFILSGLDNRIKTAVVGVTVVYGNQYSAVNSYNFAPRIKDKPLLMIMGDNDGYYTPKSATQLFNSIGGENNELIFFEGRHKIQPSYIPAIVDWFVIGLTTFK